MKILSQNVNGIRARIAQGFGKAIEEMNPDIICIQEVRANEKQLPKDFLSTITCYALGIEKSDIKEVTTNALMNAAVMAKMGNDNPSDHLKGLFTDYMKDDINKRAWILFQEKNKKDKK